MSNNTKFDLCINKEDLKCCVCLKNLVSLPLLQNSGGGSQFTCLECYREIVPCCPICRVHWIIRNRWLKK